MTDETTFETAEVGDRFEREHGHSGEWEVIEVREGFGGEPVRLVLETESVATNVDNKTLQQSFGDVEFEREFAPIEDG